MHLKTKSHFNYSKFGYIFIAPFFLTYALFSLYPLIYTFYISNFKEKSIKKGEYYQVYLAYPKNDEFTKQIPVFVDELKNKEYQIKAIPYSLRSTIK